MREDKIVLPAKDGARATAPEKRKKTAFDRLRTVLMILCALVFLICAGWLLWLTVEARIQKQDSRNTVNRYVTAVTAVERPDFATDGEEGDEEDGEEVVVSYVIDFDALQEESANAVAWIQIPAIEEIDYPVVQGSDNSYYLTHSWDNKSIRYGAIFMDASCSPDFNDAYPLIYGHYMKNGTMFGGLLNYQDESFYRENGGTILIYLPTETRFYEIFSVEVVGGSDSSVFTLGFTHSTNFLNYIQNMADNSLYDTGVTLSATDKVITLSTCTGSHSAYRLVVHAKLVSSVAIG